MWNSRQLVQLGTLAVALAFAGGCWQTQPTDDVSNANFLIDKGEVRYAPANRQLDTKWLIPLADTYVFKACLIDRMQRKSAIRQRFDVMGDDGLLAENRETDPAGCLEWSEQIPFNYFAQESKSVVIERQIVGAQNGTMRGSRVAIYVINPWAVHRGERIENVFFNNESALRDYVARNNVARGREAVRLALEASSFVTMRDGSTQDQRSLLQINDLTTHITKAADHPTSDRPLDVSVNTLDTNGPRAPGGQGAQLEMDIAFRPVVMVRDARGIDYPMPIRNGRFRVYARIIGINQGRNADEAMFITPPIPLQTATLRTSDFIARAQMRTVLTRQITRGRYMLALKVVPAEGPNLRPFEGLYLLGEFNQLRGKTAPTLRLTNESELREQVGFSYDRLEAAIRENDERLIREGWARVAEPFEYSMMDIRWLRIRPGETATSRTVEYRAYTCVTDADSGREMAHDQFVITQEGEPPIERRSNEFGCLDWVGAITHPYYKPENLYFRTVRIRHVSSNYERELTLAINPWDDKFTFGVDRRLMDENYFRRIRDRNPPDSRFFLAGFQYQTLRFRYEIDEFMNLRVKKTVLMTLEPRVVRYSSIVLGRNATEKLRDGIYLMKIALQKDYLDPARDGVTLARTEVPKRDPRTGRVEMELDARGQPTGRPQKVAAFRPLIGDQREKPLEYITTQTKLVRVQDGKIITPITFSMRDLRLMRIRKFFFVQFETIDEKMLSAYNLLEGRQKELLEQHRQEIERSRQALNEGLARDGLASSGEDDESGRMAEARQRLEAQNQQNALFSTMNDVMRRLHQLFMGHGSNGLSNLDNQTAIEGLFRFGGRRPITEDELSAIEQNDFTLIGLNPVADLEPLIDRDSGLGRRTFVGPLTLINNTNSSAMVATDVIDVCQSTDCEDVTDVVQRQPGWIAADNSAYENSRFYGSINHFRNLQVDTLIERARDLEVGYQMESRLNGQIYTYLNDFNLFFVSLRDEELFKVKSECQMMERPAGVRLTTEALDQAVAPCLERAEDRNLLKTDFLARLNQFAGQSRKLTEQDLREVVKTGRVTQALAARLCFAMVPLIRASLERRPSLNALMREQYFSDPNFDGDLKHNCLSIVNRATRGLSAEQINQEAVARVFSLEKRLRIRQTGQYRFKGGKSINVNVARNVSVSLSSSTSVHYGLSFDILGLLTGGRMGGKLNFNVDRRRQNQRGTTITEQTFLVMQSATFDIELLKYEECMLFRFAPEFIGSMVNRNLPSYVGARAQFRGLQEAVSGVMICSGEEESRPLPVRERYYYFTQHFTEGDMLDQGDIYNHPWLLSIRGVRDMRAFLYLLHQQEGGSFAELFNPRLYFTLGQDEEWVFNQMARAYTRMLPTFPGLYTVLSGPEADQVTSFPHTPNAADSFATEQVDPDVSDGIPEPLRERMERDAPP